MELKDVFGEIEADGADLVHGRLLEWALTPPLWHAEAVGGRPPHHHAPVLSTSRCKGSAPPSAPPAASPAPAPRRAASAAAPPASRPGGIKWSGPARRGRARASR